MLRLGHGRPRQTPTLLILHHFVLVAGAVSGVLLRSDDREFSALPFVRLSRLVRSTHGHPVRQSSKRGIGTPRGSDSFQPAAVGTGSSLSFRSASLPGTRRESKRPRGKSHSVCTRFVLGGAHLHYPGGMQSPGARMAG